MGQISFFKLTMPKIAFLDVDQTLVDNHSSIYNENLIQFLVTYPFDEVYLVTGRNTNDFWQHVLQMGKKPNNWRQQLLYQVVENLKNRGINVVAVSTPYDHYLNKTTSHWQQQIGQAGDAAEKIYIPFEREISALSDTQITAGVLNQRFNQKTGGEIYNDGLGGKTSLTEALPMYLAATNDTEKKGQFEFLLKRIAAKNPQGNLNIYFFDDKEENLRSAQAVFADHPRITAHCVHVDKVEGYTVPSAIQQATDQSLTDIKIQQLLNICIKYRNHFNPKTQRDAENIAENNNPQFKSLGVRKCYLINQLITILSSNTTNEEKLFRFTEAFKNVKPVIEQRQDSFAIKFLKAVATILSLGTLIFFGIWQVKGRELAKKVDQALGNLSTVHQPH